MIPVFPNYVFINDSSLTRQIQDNVLRSQNEVGPNKTRPKSCSPIFQIGFQVTICEQDYQNFLTWFRSDISYGANWFLLPDPFDGVQKRFRFAETQIQFSKNNHVFQSNFLIESYDA